MSRGPALARTVRAAALLTILMAAPTLGPRGAQAQTEGGSAESDREALIALYHATDGPNWTDSTNWLSDAPLGEWYGVRTGADGRVTELLLSTNRLSGPLPTELGTLTGLRRLLLGANRANRAEVPRWLGNLTSLEELDLSTNGLTGRLPDELGNLTNLRRLNLGYNNLGGQLPAWLGNLTSLEELWLGPNEFTGAVPDELGNLTSLRTLVLWNNRLTGQLPAWLGSLHEIEWLALSGNLMVRGRSRAKSAIW